MWRPQLTGKLSCEKPLRYSKNIRTSGWREQTTAEFANHKPSLDSASNKEEFLAIPRYDEGIRCFTAAFYVASIFHCSLSAHCVEQICHTQHVNVAKVSAMAVLGTEVHTTHGSAGELCLNASKPIRSFASLIRYNLPLRYALRAFHTPNVLVWSWAIQITADFINRRFCPG